VSLSPSTPRADDPLVLRARDVVRLIGLSAKTITRQVREGKFPAPIRLGENRVGWLRSDIDTWLQQQAAKRPATGWTPPEASASPEPRTSRYPPRAGQGTRRAIDAARRAGPSANAGEGPGVSPAPSGDRGAGGT
jgi:prophage regulatory protein